MSIRSFGAIVTITFHFITSASDHADHCQMISHCAFWINSWPTFHEGYSNYKTYGTLNRIHQLITGYNLVMNSVATLMLGLTPVS